MFTRSTRRRSLLAMAGVTAGVASVVVGSTAVNAQASDSEPEAQTGPDGRIEATEPTEMAPDAGPCFSWTVSRGFVGTTPTFINVPTTARGNNDRDCTLRNGNFNMDGVFKLQDAIRKCYPQFSAGVGFDGDYGDNTERAVRQIQFVEGVRVDGVYGPETKTAMNWPAYRQSNDQFFRCVLLRT